MAKKISDKLKNKCLGKIKHTLSSAEYTLSKTKFTKGILEIYKCEFCKAYHIGHKPGTKKPQNKL